MKSKKSDEELFSMFKQGDMEAFTLLYNRYWKDLIKKSQYKLHNQSDSEEVVQNVFINLYKWNENIVLKGYFRNYIYTILRNEIFHLLSSRIRETAYIQLDDPSLDFIQSDNMVMNRLEFKEFEDKVGELIDALPEKCKLIFRMSRDDGLSAKQISVELQISHRTVETQLSKAIRSLKNAIKQFNIILFL